MLARLWLRLPGRFRLVVLVELALLVATGSVLAGSRARRPAVSGRCRSGFRLTGCGD